MLRLFNSYKILIVCFALLSLYACEASVPDGRIRFKNESQDSSYNVVEISAAGSAASLKPSEAFLLPKGTRGFQASRRYKDYTRIYRVECPAISGKGILIKLIDVHLNRMPGGCILTYANMP